MFGGMKESDIRNFLEGDLDARWIARNLKDDAAATELVADLDEAVCLTPEEMRRLCDAHLREGLPADDEGTPEGELVAEILWDWAMPEDEAPPSTEAVKACRERLTQA